MLELTMIVLVLSGLGLWALAYSGKDTPYFRLLFMVFGFLAFIGAFAENATFTSAYTVPANTTVAYYNATAIRTLTSLNYGYMYMFIVGLFIYLAIELMLYIRILLDRRKKARAEYDYSNYNKM
ncbi:MAG: hypothetical protein QW478_08870 [Candidatus Micrarchaeaceae archaeon]